MAADRIVPCIWLDDQAEAAATLDLAASPDGRIDAFEASVPSQKTEGRVRLARPERDADASRSEAAKHV